MRERERRRPGQGTPEKLSHEKLRVYQVATQFLATALEILERLPKGHASLADQLKRASLFIPLNIAEGAGRTSKADGARFFAIARGSALECGAVLDACQILGLCDKAIVQRGKDQLVAAVSMLSSLSR